MVPSTEATGTMKGSDFTIINVISRLGWGNYASDPVQPNLIFIKYVVGCVFGINRTSSMVLRSCFRDEVGCMVDLLRTFVALPLLPM